MGDLVQTVKNGTVEQNQTNSTTKTSGSNLNKDAFLQLLTTQLKYQDPLNPSSDTEFISQLATFSQLEQMQNLGTLTTNSQAFSLVGKNVIIKADSSTTGNSSYISGKVDFVNMSNGKTQISVNGNLYSIDQLDSVIDDNYVLKQGLPGLDSAVKLQYDASNPKDLSFDVKMGTGDTVASDAAIAINNNVVSNDLVSVSNGKVTIDKSAFSNLQNGTYDITVGFNDSQLTTVSKMVTLQVTNSTVTATDSGSTTDQT